LYYSHQHYLPSLHNTPAPPPTYTLSLHDALPIYPSSSDPNDRTQWSWAFQILPYIEQGNIYKEKSNNTIFKTPIPIYYSPSRRPDRKSTRLNSSHEWISYAVFCLKKKKKQQLHNE